jgi:S1-C subfamily serine protease
MNTMIFSKSGSSAGIGFAVPVATIARVVPQIIRSGKAEQLGLGIQVDPLSRIERRAGIRGVAVLSVPERSQAEKAGLRGVTQTLRGLALGDVIVGIDGAKVDDFDDLYNALDAHHAGDIVEVKLRRGEEAVSVKLEVLALP